jgi:hypothetical protein
MNKIYIGAMSLALATGLGLAGSASAASVTTGANLGVQIGGMFHRGGQEGQDGQGDVNHGVFGTVTAVSGNTITITDKQSNTTYTIDATNAKIDKNKATISVSNIVVGDTIMVQGTVSGTTVTATAIHDGVAFGRMMSGSHIPGVVGTVTAISGSTITVSSKGFGPNATATTYTVDASNATVQKDGSASSVANIAVGDTIMVQGTISGTTVTATKINDGKMGTDGADAMLPDGNGQPIIGGTVTAVSGSTITITNKSNTAYTIDASSATVTKNGTTGSVSNVAVGDNILAQGTVNGTAVTAVSVTDQAKAQTGTSGTANPVRGFFGRIGNFFSHLFGF